MELRLKKKLTKIKQNATVGYMYIYENIGTNKISWNERFPFDCECMCNGQIPYGGML